MVDKPFNLLISFEVAYLHVPPLWCWEYFFKSIGRAVNVRFDVKQRG